MQLKESAKGLEQLEQAWQPRAIVSGRDDLPVVRGSRAAETVSKLADSKVCQENFFHICDMARFDFGRGRFDGAFRNFWARISSFETVSAARPYPATGGGSARLAGR